ncbi:MAG: glycosyltransferase family 2 protein [Thermoplasmatales archaeon]|nr:glycosyltransferase family 2 protein [Thermoplasmatales archaeon]
MISIVIPTYNEKENIEKLIEKIFDACRNIETEVVVVDDNSPDGTGQVAEKLKEKYNLHVLIRKNKTGLSSAVLDGFKIAKGDIFGVMDADLSHPPDAIQVMLKPIIDGKADFVIGSRYAKGGNIENWSVKRKIVSKGATFLAKPLTRIDDPMSGFFFLKKEIINHVNLNPKGYKIGLEILVKGRYRNVIELPYTFRDRKHGKSKLNFKEYKNYLLHLLMLYSYKKSIFHQFFKFCIVGGIGVLVNICVLYSLVEFLYLWYMFAAVVAFVVAVSSNFVLNKIWTFKEKSKGIKVAGQYSKFFIVCIIGLLINLGVLYILVQYGNMWYVLAQLVAIGVATLNNFVGSKFWVFK